MIVPKLEYFVLNDPIRAAEEIIALRNEVERWEQMWDNVRLDVPSLREDNKPLAVAACYQLLRNEVERLTRGRDAMIALIRNVHGRLLDDRIDAALAGAAGQPTVALDDEADRLLRALGMDPERFRTECGFLNVPKAVAALKHPADYAGLYLKAASPHPCIHTECPEPHWCKTEGKCLGPMWKASNE